MSTTKIPWAQESWNPVTGCTPVGEGCKNCYARTMSLRLKAMGNPKYRNGFKVTCHPDELNAKVLRKRKPQRIFVCSMGDLFHCRVRNSFIRRAWNAMVIASQHTFIVLTKRPERMCSWVKARDLRMRQFGPIEPNIWLGVSVSTQREADKQIPILLQCPAAVRFVSYEPALELINLAPYIDFLNWVIVGCESGPKRRPFSEHWARCAKLECAAAEVPFFYKQGRDEKNKVVHRPYLDGRRYEEYPCQERH